MINDVGDSTKRLDTLDDHRIQLDFAIHTNPTFNGLPPTRFLLSSVPQLAHNNSEQRSIFHARDVLAVPLIAKLVQALCAVYVPDRYARFAVMGYLWRYLVASERACRVSHA